MMLLLNVYNKQSFVEGSDVQYTYTHTRVRRLVAVSTFPVHVEILLFHTYSVDEICTTHNMKFYNRSFDLLEKNFIIKKKKRDTFGSLMRKFLFFRLQQNMTQATNLEGAEKNLILKCKIRACNQEKKLFLFIYMPSKFVIVTLLNIQCFNLS